MSLFDVRQVPAGRRQWTGRFCRVARTAMTVAVTAILAVTAPTVAADGLIPFLANPKLTENGADMVSAAARARALPDLASVVAIPDQGNAPSSATLGAPCSGSGGRTDLWFEAVEADRKGGPAASSLLEAATYGNLISRFPAPSAAEAYGPADERLAAASVAGLPLWGLRQPLAGWMQSSSLFTSFSSGSSGLSWSADGSTWPGLYGSIPSGAATVNPEPGSTELSSHSVLLIAIVLLGVFGMSVVLLVARWREGSTSVIAITEPPKSPAVTVIDVVALPPARKEGRQ
jgi:hypothetical protein